MRVAAVVLGVLLFVLGGAWAALAAANAYGLSESNAGTDWTCTADNGTQRCTFGIGNAVEAQLEVTGELTQTVLGAAAAVCGVLFIGIGTRRPPVAAPQPPVAYGPPMAGPPPGYRG